MATEAKAAESHGGKRSVEAPVLGTTRVPPAARDELLHPDPAPLHAVPKDTGAEATLARVESLLGRGHFGAALREAEALRLDDPALAGRYAFVRQEKLSRASIGIAERYFLRGDREGARRFYEQALRPDDADPAVRQVAELAGRAFDDLTRRRRELIRGLKEDARARASTRSGAGGGRR